MEVPAIKGILLSITLLFYMKPPKYFFLPRPLKSKTNGFHPSTGRNHKGQITAWHRGGGHAKRYRQIDLQRKFTQGITVGLEYDPNRAAFLARVFNPDTLQHSYILAPTGLKSGDTVRSNSRQSGYQNGHSKTLRHILSGTLIFNLSMKPGKDGKFLRSPGSFGKIVKKTENLAKIRLKSGDFRWFDIETIATNGTVSNTDSRFVQLRKAGRARWLGCRPIVRGVAMNPVDHPHGGGEGKTSGGRPSVTPWAKPTKGPSTRTHRIKPNPKKNDKI
uniref:ribosomal protein L2 n=1 Tax=Scytothamnus australis TaxID=66621 RepID=UPI002E769AA5|nr:ribosomal protein L2 [Scytothamnus australis]WBP70302.1 ribosomal protein L2 [Scytothamnus australis]